MQLDGIVNSK